jgi:hypothetical protein
MQLKTESVLEYRLHATPPVPVLVEGVKKSDLKKGGSR